VITAIASARGESYYHIAYGASDELCLAQFNLLAARRPAEEFPVCDIGVRLPSHAQKAEWQELDILQNLTIIQRIEWELRFEISPPPHEQYEIWFQQLQQRLKNPKTRPHLRRFALPLRSDGQTNFIYGYSTGPVDCDPSTADLVRPSSPSHYPGMRFFMYDKQWPLAVRLPELPGRLVLYKGQPHVFSAALTDRTHYWEWSVSIYRLHALPATHKNPYPNALPAPSARHYKAEHVCSIGVRNQPLPRQ
jgi:hypothetical protein